VLSRIAESMFWIGRYVERAESTARILDVHYHLVVQDALVDESAACAALLSVMGARDAVGNDVTLESINEVLGYSLKHPSSIASTLFAARENARGAREGDAQRDPSRPAGPGDHGTQSGAELVLPLRERARCHCRRTRRLDAVS
jgi:hypothetical protein